jgi:ABC-type Fe3+-hydroxamate transport system substrate-binding protein
MTDSAPDESEYIHAFRVERPISFVPQRVVSLVPSITESLFDLNLGARLVGVTEYCTRPAEGVARLPKVSGTKNPDVDRIIALRPDLVMMNREENRKADADVLEAAGIAVWATNPKTVREAIDLLWLLMDVFEDASMTHRVRLIEVTYETTARYMSESTEIQPLRAFVPIWRDPWMTFNRDTYIHDILLTCGAENIFADRERQFPLSADLGQGEAWADDDPRLEGRDRRYPRIALDEVIAAQPEILLLPSEPYAFTDLDGAELGRTLAETPAGRNGHIYLVDGSLLTWHGTRLAYALRDLPPLIAEARTDS